MARYLNPQTCKRKRPCVTLITYNFSLTRAAFLRSLPNQIPLLLKYSLLHSTPRLGPGILLGISIELLPTRPLQPFCFAKCDFCFLRAQGRSGVIQAGAQHGVFGPTEVCLLRGPLHGPQGRNIYKAMHM